MAGNKSYRVEEGKKLVSKRLADGGEELTDMATYAYHHLKLHEKTNSVDKDLKFVFADLSSEEIAAAFLCSTDAHKRKQLFDEVRFGMLFDTTAWLARNMQQGCVKCAPYLQRSVLAAYPSRPIELVDSLPSFRERERSMAHNLLKAITENPGQENFLLFVGRNHMFSVAKQFADFVSNPESVAAYQRPN